jgi:hypothetical protein
MDKIIPRLSDFQVMPSNLKGNDRFYFVIYRNQEGELRLAQWLLDAFPDGVQPLYFHPLPVDRLNLSNGFHEEVKRKLPWWEAAFPEVVA